MTAMGQESASQRPTVQRRECADSGRSRTELELIIPAIAVIPRRHAGRPHRQPVVALADVGMIRPKSRSRRGPQMSAMADGTLADP
jgi:hypothetical protein